MTKIRAPWLFGLLFFLIINCHAILFVQAEEQTRDPFLSLADSINLQEKPLDISKLPYPIVLNGIIWTEKLQLAIINNETVEKNQVWRDLQVEDIQKTKVILKLGENRFEIPLASEEKNEEKKN